MAESGLSREQLNTFAAKADTAASGMEGAVTTLGNDLSHLSGISRGAWIRKFDEVKIQIQDQLNIMNRALHETSDASRGAHGHFDQGDADMASAQSSVESQTHGLTGNLIV